MGKILQLVLFVLAGIYFIYDGIAKLKKGKSTVYNRLFNRRFTIRDKVTVRLVALTEFTLAFFSFFIALCVFIW